MASCDSIHPFEHLSDTLQRLDFIVFDLIPTLSFPFYIVYLVLMFGAGRRAVPRGDLFAAALDFAFQLALAFALFRRSPGLAGLAASLIFPLYQGVYLKCARFFSYSSEIVFAASRHDDFVPPRVRQALLGRSS